MLPELIDVQFGDTVLAEAPIPVYVDCRNFEYAIGWSLHIAAATLEEEIIPSVCQAAVGFFPRFNPLRARGPHIDL